MPSTPRPTSISRTSSSTTPHIIHPHPSSHMSTPISTTPRSSTPRATGGSRAVVSRAKGAASAAGGANSNPTSRRDSPARGERTAAAAAGAAGGLLGSDLERDGTSGISGGEDVGPSSGRKGSQVEVPVGVPLPKGMLNVPGLRAGQNQNQDQRQEEKAGRGRGGDGAGKKAEGVADRLGKFQLGGVGMNVNASEGTEGEERGMSATSTPGRAGRVRGNKKKSGGVQGAEKGRTIDGDTSLEDVFTSTPRQRPPNSTQPQLQLQTPTPTLPTPFPPTFASTQSPRRPRHQRTRSEPLSIVSGFDGEEHIGGGVGKVVKPAARGEKVRRKRKKKEKDRQTGDAVGESTDGDLTGKINGLAEGEEAGEAVQVKPRMMGLRMPLAEEDDIASVLSGMEDESTSEDQQIPEQQGLSERYDSGGYGDDDRFTSIQALAQAQAQGESDFASLSKSAPGDKSYFMMNRGGGSGRGGDGYNSSGYQSGGYGDREQGGGGNEGGNGNGNGRKSQSQRRNVVEDESAVWEMPGEEERGSGAALTWQQAMLAGAGGATKQRSSKPSDTPSTSRQPNPKSTSTPSAPSRSHTAPQSSARKTTTGFNARKTQARDRDEETFGSTAIAPFVPNQTFNAVKPYQPGHGSPGLRSSGGGGGGGKGSMGPAAAMMKVYAGPTFQNSPSADSLPAPKLKGVAQ